MTYLTKSCSRPRISSPITSENEILERSEEEPRDFDKTSNTIIDIQTPTLQKSLSYENLGTPQDIRNIRVF